MDKTNHNLNLFSKLKGLENKHLKKLYHSPRFHICIIHTMEAFPNWMCIQGGIGAFSF